MSKVGGKLRDEWRVIWWNTGERWSKRGCRNCQMYVSGEQGVADL